LENLCRPVAINVESLVVTDTHYFRQPGLKAIRFSDGSTGISQENVGGLRVVDIENIGELEQNAWDSGYLWIDYITSWNDRKTKSLEQSGWKRDFQSVVPWRLNPL